jgi:hypothetical protein
VADLEGTTFGISRLGSGSQVMASVLSMNEKWSGQPKFKGKLGGISALTAVNGQFKPLRDSVNSGESMSPCLYLLRLASAFLWEWFTTKPFVDSGEVRFIGSVLSMSLPIYCANISAVAMLEYRCIT